MVRISKLYTRSGDSGETGLTDGSRIGKDSAQILSLAIIDELNSYLGVCAEHISSSSLLNKIRLLQQEMFDIGAYVASPANNIPKSITPPKEEWVDRLEKWIDELTNQQKPLTSFILPSGGLLATHLHIARCISRRCEIQLISFSKTESEMAHNRLRTCLMYLNRLSDLLFALARQSATDSGNQETLWIPASKR